MNIQHHYKSTNKDDYRAWIKTSTNTSVYKKLMQYQCDTQFKPAAPIQPISMTYMG